MATADPFLEGFQLQDIEVGELSIRTSTAGEGPPVLLVHGHPQTHSTWYAVAPELAKDHSVVAIDLRGHGDSAKPPSGGDHSTYSKRSMAADAVAAMAALGHQSFPVIGHDRGGRVAHRMALDHPDAVERLAVLDISPTLSMYESTAREFATRYWHWFFLIQAEPLPERLIGADPEFYFRQNLDHLSKTEWMPRQDVIAEYLRCYSDPASIHAACEDYRASSSIDLEYDRADLAAGRLITQPLLALWGGLGVVGELFDVLADWQAVSAAEVTGRAVRSGHNLQEEAPGEVLAELASFLA